MVDSRAAQEQWRPERVPSLIRSEVVSGSLSDTNKFSSEILRIKVDSFTLI